VPLCGWGGWGQHIMGVATVAQRFAYAIVVLVDVVPSLAGNGTFLCTYTPRRK
jgi:hypothetical protein